MAAEGVSQQQGAPGALVHCGTDHGFNALDDDELDAWLADDSADDDGDTHDMNSQQLAFPNHGVDNRSPFGSEGNDRKPKIQELNGATVAAASVPPTRKVNGLVWQQPPTILKQPPNTVHAPRAHVKLEAPGIPSEDSKNLATADDSKNGLSEVRNGEQLVSKELSSKPLGPQPKQNPGEHFFPAVEEKFKRLNKPRIRDLIEHGVFQEGDRLNYRSRIDDRDFPCSVTVQVLDFDKRLIVNLAELPLLLEKVPFLMKQQEAGVRGIAFIPLPNARAPVQLLMSVSFFKLLALWYQEDFRDEFRFKSDQHAYDDKDLVVVKMRGLVLPEPIPLKAIRDQFAEDSEWDFDQGMCGCRPPHSKPELRSKMQRSDSNGTTRPPPGELQALGRSPSAKNNRGTTLTRPLIEDDKCRIEGGAGRLAEACSSSAAIGLPMMQFPLLWTKPSIADIAELRKISQEGQVLSVLGDMENGSSELRKRIKTEDFREWLQANPLQPEAGRLSILENLSSRSTLNGNTFGSSAGNNALDEETVMSSGMREKSNALIQLEKPASTFSFNPDQFFQKVRSPVFIEKVQQAMSASIDTDGSVPRGETKRREVERVMSIENVKNLLASWDARKRTPADLNRMVTSLCTHETTRNAMQRQFQAAARTLARVDNYAEVRTHLLKLVLIVGDDKKYVGMYAAEAVLSACQRSANIKTGMQKDQAAKEVLKNLRSRFGPRREKMNAKAGDLLVHTILGKVK